MVKNEYEYLKLAITLMDDNNICDKLLLEDASGLDSATSIKYLKFLEANGYITSNNLQTMRITSKAIKSTKVSSKLLTTLKKGVPKTLWQIIIGIFIAVAAAIVIFKLGIG